MTGTRAFWGTQMRPVSSAQSALYTGTWAHVLALVLCVAGFGSLTLASRADGLADNRGYELVTPVQKNGVTPYAAIPSPSGGNVDFQARGAFAGASWGSLNLYQANRSTTGWQTMSITPAPTTPLGSLEEQAPVWTSQDLSKAIFTTPQSFAIGDQDHGSLSLYEQTSPETLAWVSQGIQGATEPKQATFDAATPDGNNVVFSTGASLTANATGLSSETAPEAEYLYGRSLSALTTSLLGLDPNGQLAGYAATTLPEGFTSGREGSLLVKRTEGFFPGQFITVGEGSSAEVTQINSVNSVEGQTERLEVGGGAGLPSSFPPGAPVVHQSEGVILGDGGHLTSGPPPAGEYVQADSGSGSTTNAISTDGSKVFFEAPNPSAGEPVGLYVRQNNSTTIEIAGAHPYGTAISGAFQVQYPVFGSARFEGASADGSLVFFTSEEGLGGATPVGRELYEYNTTSHTIGSAVPLSATPVSAGLNGDKVPATTLTASADDFSEALTVASTAGFHAGEEILFAPFNWSSERELTNSDEVATIAAVKSPTELLLTEGLTETGNGIPPGTEVHGVHPASLVAVSSDGSHVFFESNGVLASNQNAEGSEAAAAQPNLYVFETQTGSTTFIGTLIAGDVSKEGNPAGLAGEPDISRPAVPTPDGSALVFASAANLTGRNPWQEYTEIYRYAVEGEALTCLSCTAPGVKPTGNATFGETAGGTYDPPGLTSPMSEDGSRVFFQTLDSLVTGDTNGAAPLSPKFETPTSTDVYEWEAGKVALISSGSATTPAVLQGTNPSGDDVLFTTTAQLVPGEGDGGYENLFDARVGGGFPESAQAAPACFGAGCRATFGVAPSFGAPASAALHGAGGASGVLGAKAKAKARLLACGRGRVRRRVKGRVVCVKKARKAGRGGVGVRGSR